MSITYRANGRTYPEWIPNEKKDQVIFKFLSLMADHYGKSMPWIRKTYQVYLRKFAKIPVEFLSKNFDDFCGNYMGTNQGDNADYRFIPSPALIYSWLIGQSGFVKRWIVTDFGAFCLSCRSAADGKEGGFRQIYIRYTEPEKEEIKIREYVGTCDCIATDKASNVKGIPYMSVIQHFQSKYENIEAFHSYWCEETERRVSAREQSSQTWQRRLAAGYVLEKNDSYCPDWNHSYWSTAVGLALAEMLGWEHPNRKEIEYNLKRGIAGAAVEKRWTGQRRSREDGKVDVPRSISSLL
tara:strand:- start:78 stop:965 length:888 start_codon:yes stop_codon:yes gene_type:complete